MQERAVSSPLDLSACVPALQVVLILVLLLFVYAAASNNGPWLEWMTLLIFLIMIFIAGRVGHVTLIIEDYLTAEVYLQYRIGVRSTRKSALLKSPFTPWLFFTKLSIVDAQIIDPISVINVSRLQIYFSSANILSCLVLCKSLSQTCCSSL